MEHGHIDELRVETQFRAVERVFPKRTRIRHEDYAFDVHSVQTGQNPLENVHFLVVRDEAALRDDTAYIFSGGWVGDYSD